MCRFNDTMLETAISWCAEEGHVPTRELVEWIHHRNKLIQVEIHKISLNESSFWYYDQEQGAITNLQNSFFNIRGLRCQSADGKILEQPIIIQNEIGYLGIICKKIDGILHFLMQAKIEPGNINKIQISPTIQATKSNFTQKHGGKQPAYLEYFLNSKKYEIIVDQIQSEQSSRFFHKRNRNIIIRIERDIEQLPNFQWMTLGQIKHLMRFDNLVNMDTRTVLSCLPFSMTNFDNQQLRQIQEAGFSCVPLFNSVFRKSSQNILPEIYQEINNQKMFSETHPELCDIFSLQEWKMCGSEFICCNPYPFKLIFCDISIEGREVQHWTQPLFEANGIAIFALFCTEIRGVLQFLVHVTSEVGCFDIAEIGPSIQLEAGGQMPDNLVGRLLLECLQTGNGIFHDVMLSEEGGRFYCEQNRNLLIKIPNEKLRELPQGYFWADYYTLNLLTQINNCLNIQLRNLLSLLEVFD
ncbi:NDP-hexose 2,3-dehydratase family protein [Anaerotruncus colihominis]|uniref:NDP-hexose 2,3-dehydratase family protein n=1 Tax=Anaerotruncus colihominis TaxID=169435 RepID=UPI001FAC646B|nr:NDP-hexose 2,3-dehydratase family protein [Anaerotruncus colihominis]